MFIFKCQERITELNNIFSSSSFSIFFLLTIFRILPFLLLKIPSGIVFIIILFVREKMCGFFLSIISSSHISSVFCLPIMCHLSLCILPLLFPISYTFPFSFIPLILFPVPPFDIISLFLISSDFLPYYSIIPHLLYSVIISYFPCSFSHYFTFLVFFLSFLLISLILSHYIFPISYIFLSLFPISCILSFIITYFPYSSTDQYSFYILLPILPITEALIHRRRGSIPPPIQFSFVKVSVSRGNLYVFPLILSSNSATTFSSAAARKKKQKPQLISILQVLKG